MKLSMEWLSAYIDLDGVSPQQLADKLTQAGLEVEAVEARAGGELAGVVVGLVVACEPHPNADKLKVCQVDIGDSNPSTIVCGAPNVRPGMKVPVAVPGSVLPGGPIGVAKLRGVESSGMLCSAKEIGLEVRLLPKDQTIGLYVLPENLPVGADVAELLALDDWILDISLTPNRSDCLSMRGLAHEVAALLERPLWFDEDADAARNEADAAHNLRVELRTERCPKYAAQVMEDVQVAESPLWMQMRLLAMGVRPISNIVDITNYVMLEWGQPLHAFDLDQVHGGTIVVRQASEGEPIITLDAETRVLTSDTIVIADVDRAIGIAGVMGGENSEITETTRRVVLESAAFDPTSVRRTGQRLGLRSEAQQRFEKGIDPKAIDSALARAAELFQSICGARLMGPPVVADSTGDEKTPEVAVPFSPSYANQFLGTTIEADAMEDIFARLGFVVHRDVDDAWRVVVPSRRPDLRLTADLVEEVARIYGYDAIPSSLSRGVTTVGARTPSQRLRLQTRQLLTSLGMYEVFAYTFTEPTQMDALRIPEQSPLRRMVPLLHPMSEERTVLRTHLLPGLASIAQHNLAHGQDGGEIFEIGRTYLAKSLPPTEIPEEPLQLGMMWFGSTSRSYGTSKRPYDFYDAKGIVETWLRSLGVSDPLQFHHTDTPWLHPGRSAQVAVGDCVIGTFGELHPDTAQAFDVGRAVYAEFALEPLLAAIESLALRAKPLQKFPAVDRDLAVLVPTAVDAGSLVEVARDLAAQSAESWLESCTVFDVYTGKGVPEGLKSIAVGFVYRVPDRTLTDAEVAGFQAAIVERWAAQFGAKLRAGI